MFESWTRLTDAPFARVNHQAVILNDSLYIFGGFSAQRREFDSSSSQIDVFRWDIHHQIWIDLKYPLRLKTWNCISKSWGPDPLLSDDGSIHPTHRFGHTVVAWRGRGWLFGGRNHRQLCSNHVYMFEPGCLSSSSLEVAAASESNTRVLQTENYPCWALIDGIKGCLPTPRDGHAAAVLENNMFIFGGYEDESGSYDNQIYRLDFYSWSWTRIQIHTLPTLGLSSSLFNSSEQSSRHPQPEDDGSDDVEPDYLISQDHTPLARDFACLVAHRGRLFVFGGRSECSARSGYDVYDSAIWELVPIALEREHSICALSAPDISAEHTLSLLPSQCTNCTTELLNELSAREDLHRMAWEEDTGNWASSDSWYDSPPRPCCLWKLFSSGNTEALKSYTEHCRRNTGISSSRWTTGRATWVRLHPGHGLQLPDHLLPRMFDSAARPQSAKNLVSLSSPYGRRSLSSWAFQGHLYIGFGTVRCQTRESWQLHCHDIWRFSLADKRWSMVETLKTTDQLHEPSARRRAVASLYIPRPSLSSANAVSHSCRPRVFLFGGTQPRLLCKTSLTGARDRNSFRRTTHARLHLLRQFTERFSQNHVLHLVNGNTNSSSSSTLNNATLPDITYAPVSSPVVILVIGSPRNPSLKAPESLFHLFVVLPSTCSPSSTMTNSPYVDCNYPVRSLILCVLSWTDLRNLFSPSATPTVFESHGLIDRLLCNTDADSDIDRPHIYNALRCSWLATQRFGKEHLPPNAETGDNEVHRLRLFILRSTGKFLPEKVGHTARTSTMSDEYPLLLVQQSYKLYANGLVHPELQSACVSNSEWYMLAPWIGSVISSSLNLLMQSVDHLLDLGDSPSSHEPLISKRSLLSVAGHCNAHLWFDSAHLLLPTPPLATSREPLVGISSEQPSIALFLQQALPQLRSAMELDLLNTTPQISLPRSLDSDPLGIQTLTKLRRPSLHEVVINLPSTSLAHHESDHISPEDFRCSHLLCPFLNQNLHHHPGEMEEHSEDSMDIQPDSVLLSNDSDSSDSDNDGSSEAVVLDNIGSLVKGKEKLFELADFYVLQLNTSLYDLCLRCLRSLEPSAMLSSLPKKIIHDLNGIAPSTSTPNFPER